MSKVWLYDGKVVLFGGKVLLCDVCPCDDGGGSGITVCDGLYYPFTAELVDASLASLSMDYYENSVLQCSETWTWNENVVDPGWVPPEPTDVNDASLCNAMVLLYCDSAETGCDRWKLRGVGIVVPDSFVLASVSCSDDPFVISFEWTAGTPPVNHRVNFAA